jgi:leader peptidase (prepilin peptidase)/N-methyltransferase
MSLALMGLYALLGLGVGVLVNRLIDRLPNPETGRPFSRCLACGARPAGWDWVPVVGYVLRRGHCPTCGARWPMRTPLVELATGLTFALLWNVLGLNLLLLLYSLYFCMLEVIFVIDLEHHLILNRFIWPAIVVALLAIPLQAWLMTGPTARPDMAAPPPLDPGDASSPWATKMLTLLMGGALGLLVFAVMWLISPRGIGAGDVKLALFVGLIVGFPGIVWVIVGSFLLAGMIATALLISRRAGLKSEIPFGPSMVLATMVVLLYGDTLLRWYLGM